MKTLSKIILREREREIVMSWKKKKILTAVYL